ncbi:sensor histidine kinase [Bacillus massiliigorillae]|uniref:sensor histidine kinase n=1 Tax=Bacillus massiliigorillae TaxID=1243664 RepID=UPI0003A6F3A5|nr:HAMP domain-containing sensor histidine kinase [Bacillus massiliigorillae]
MKIKYWLMISFFLVMLLPLVGIYLLYVSIANLDQKRDVNEYFEVSMKIEDLEKILLQPKWYTYQSKKQYEEIQNLVDQTMQITLYRYDGMKLYSTLSKASLSGWDDLNEVVKDLNEIKKNNRTYSYKGAVFSEQKLVGIYEISIMRKEWVKGLTNRSVILLVLGSVLFLVIYGAIVFLLNRKLNKPLELLMKHMTAFAKGEEIQTSLIHSKDEMGEINEHFLEMKTQIEQTSAQLLKEQQNKEFIVASLSHDLKTPLTVVRAYTEALLDERRLSENEKVEYRKILFEKLSYMKQLFDDLSTYTALQSSQMKMKLVEIDGEEFFEMLLTGYEENCAKKNLALTIESEIEGTYMLDTKQMVRVMDNIVGNAIRHTPLDGALRLAVIHSRQALPEWIFPIVKAKLESWRSDGTIVLVQNEGEAVPHYMKEALFQPFVQAEEARGAGGSAGLGLSIAKELMEKQEGKIQLWSTEGYGTLVACWLKERI